MNKRYLIILLMFAGLAIVLAIFKVSSNKVTRKVGGTITIEVPRGEKVISATMKDNGSVFYLTEPMEPEYIPKVKILRENSNYGLIETKIKLREHGR